MKKRADTAAKTRRKRDAHVDEKVVFSDDATSHWQAREAEAHLTPTGHHRGPRVVTSAMSRPRERRRDAN